MEEIEIRQAQPMDVVALTNLAKRGNPAHYPPIDDLDCIRWMTRIVAIGGSFVAVHKNKIIGSLGIGINQFPWNVKSEYLTNEWFYVHPKFRRYGVAKKLLQGGKTISSQSGRPFILSLTSGTDRKLARFFAMQGFHPLGDVLTYGLEEK